MTVATQTEELENEWVSEPDTEQPMNEQDNDHDIVKNSPTDQAQATEPPVPFETAKKKKRRGKKHSDKGASFWVHVNKLAVNNQTF